MSSLLLAKFIAFSIYVKSDGLFSDCQLDGDCQNCLVYVDIETCQLIHFLKARVKRVYTQILFIIIIITFSPGGKLYGKLMVNQERNF